MIIALEVDEIETFNSHSFCSCPDLTQRLSDAGFRIDYTLIQRKMLDNVEFFFQILNSIFSQRPVGKTFKRERSLTVVHFNPHAIGLVLGSQHVDVSHNVIQNMILNPSV